MSALPRYGRASIRRSLVHFLLGKGVSSVSGIIALLLVVRSLSVADFATYSVLVAFVEIFSALAGFGFTHIILRYVPELYALHLNRSLARLIFWALLLRSLVLLAVVFAVYLASDQVAAWFGLVSWQAAFQAYLLVVGLRITATFSFQILESMLHQGFAQLAFTINAVLKLVLLTFFIWQNNLNLLKLIGIESVAEAAGLAMLLFALVKLVRQLVMIPALKEDESWLRDNFVRMLKFGLAGYGQHLATMLYGGSPNRLLMGRLFGAPVMAAFGFAQSIVDFVRRYLPGQLLAGMVRPVLLARYASSRDFGDVSKTVNLVFKTDFSLIGTGIVFFGVGGEAIISLLSKGKYDGLAGELILMMMIVLILEAFRPLLDLSLQALERNRVLLLTNLLLSTSILLVFPLSHVVGPFAVICANFLGMFINILLLLSYLKRIGYKLSLDLGAFTKLIAGLLVAVAVGRGLMFIDIRWEIASALAIAIYLFILFISNFVSAAEIQTLRSLRNR